MIGFTAVALLTVNGLCGSGGYSDIRLGSQVEIVNQDNKVLGVGTLQTEQEAKYEGFHLTLG